LKQETGREEDEGLSFGRRCPASSNVPFARGSDNSAFPDFWPFRLPPTEEV
jgi:hypothetical protein